MKADKVELSPHEQQLIARLRNQEQYNDGPREPDMSTTPRIIKAYDCPMGQALEYWSKEFKQAEYYLALESEFTKLMTNRLKNLIRCPGDPKTD